MQELSEAMSEAFMFLDYTYTPKWTTGKGSRDKLLAAMSQVDVPIEKFLGYAGSDGLRHSFKRAMPTLNKPVHMHWRIWVLLNINKFYCHVCGKVYHIINKVDNKYLCKNCDKCNVLSRRENKQLVVYNLLKSSTGCLDCEEKDPIVLEFDHRNPKEKHFNIGEGYNKSIEVLLAEISKCDIVCANCHRRRTAKQFNYFKYTQE